MEHTIRERRNKALWLILIASCVAWVALSAQGVKAGEIVKRVIRNQKLVCGVPLPFTGFCKKEKNGRWSGFTVDFCRAVAAAVLHDPEKAVYIPMKTAERIPMLLSGRIDLLAHLLTWTLGREAGIGVKFPGVYFYDGHTFMTPSKKKIRHIKDLDGAVISLTYKTNQEEIVSNVFKHQGIKFTPLVLETESDKMTALKEGRCQAYAGPRAVLSVMRFQTPNGARDFDIMNEVISKEPLCPAVQSGDDEWLTLVRWVLNALIEAEELGITKANVRGLQKNSKDPAILWFLNSSGIRGKSLGLKPDWTADVIAAVGNYGEIFERNLGAASGLNIQRDLNRLWSRGGLLYAPPFQ